jgi:MFS family permease
MCVEVSNFIWLPVMGALSDRIGRRPLLLTFTGLAIVTAYPMLSWLASAASFERLLAVGLWLSFVYARYNGAMVVFLIELVLAAVRASGFSIAYSSATAIFGGFTPAICTYLVKATGNSAIPGFVRCVARIDRYSGFADACAVRLSGRGVAVDSITEASGASLSAGWKAGCSQDWLPHRCRLDILKVNEALEHCCGAGAACARIRR